MTTLGLSRQELDEELRSDYTRSVVPPGRRRGQVTLTLTWLTGTASFSSLYTGYTLRQGGLDMWDLIIAAIIGNLLLLGYWMFAGRLGTKYGQTATVLARSFMGRWGSGIMSVLYAGATIGWYAFQADLLGTATTTLLNIPNDTRAFSVMFALLMIFNNLLGFTSVSAWAKYVTAPILIVWVLVAFTTTSSHVLFAAPHLTTAVTLGVACSTVIGAVIWGVEPDFWRWGKPKISTPLVPSIVALTFGNLLFPVAGAAIDEIHNTTSFGDVISFSSRYTLGVAGIGVAVFVISQIAINDLNLYTVTTALKNLFAGPRYWYVLGAGAVGALGAYLQVINHYILIANVTAVLVPSVSVVMITDAFLLPKLGIRREIDRVPSWREAAQINVPGVFAVAAAVGIGGWTGGIFNSSFTWGVPALQSWAVAAGVYLALALMLRAMVSPEKRRTLMGYSKLSLVAAESPPVADSPQPAVIPEPSGSKDAGSFEDA